MSKLLVLILCIANICMMQCSPQKIAGDVTETGNAVVSGRILDTHNAGATNTVVQLIPKSYNPVTGGNLPDSLSRLTDSIGHYRFIVDSKDSFTLVAVHLATNTRAFINHIVPRSGDTVLVPATTLATCGTLSIQLPADVDTVNGCLFIQGTCFFAPVTTQKGTVTIQNIPQGVVPAIYYMSQSSPAQPVLMADSAVVVSGQTTEITRLNRNTPLAIGITDWNASDPVLQKNASFFNICTKLITPAISNADLLTAVSTHIAKCDSLGLRPAFVYQRFSETSYDSIKLQMGNLQTMKDFYTQYQSALQLMCSKNAILILEPFSFGYIAQRWYKSPSTCSPDKEFVKTKSTTLAILQSYPDNYVGFMQSTIALAHSIAPDICIGVHLMNWSMAPDSSSNNIVSISNTKQDSAVKLWNTFITTQLNIKNSIDFISIGKHSVDAGLAGSAYFWQSAAMTNFLYFANALRTTLCKLLVGWYIPIGHAGLPNTPNSYEDTFAEYFFANAQDFTQAGFCTMLFGKYDTRGTDMGEGAGSGDEGWFVGKMKGF